MTCHSSHSRRLGTPGTVREEPTSVSNSPAAVEPVPSPVRIETQAPIPPAELKRKFSEDVEFILDYDAGRFKGKTLMVYLSNLDIKVQLKLNDEASALELLAEYLKITTLVKIPEMENLAINMLLAHLGRPNFLDFDPSAFLAENKASLDMWERRINSLTLFAMYSLDKEKYKDYIESFPEDPDDGVTGLNFVHLIKHELFPLLLADVPESKWNWNKKYFTEYMFAGANLFKYFADDNNPLFVGILAISDPEAFKAIAPQIEKTRQGLNELKATLQLRIDHVPSV